MKISKRWTTVTTFSRTLALILFIALPFIGFIAGEEFAPRTSPSQDQSQIINLNNQLSKANYQNQLLLDDQADISKPTTSVYDFKNVGIYSPLFVDKKVQNTVFNYRRSQVTLRTIILDKNATSGVNVWEYANWSGLPGGWDFHYAIFSGYESYGHPIQIETDPKNTPSFTNNKQIKMFWKYDYCPKSICSVKLTFFSSNTPMGNPIYAEIWVSSDFADQGTSKILNPAKQKIQEIANTIETFETHH